MKYVMVMADYMSSGLWHESGMMMDHSEIPLSPGLIKKIENWIKIYGTNDSYLPINERVYPDFMTEEFNKEGEEIKLLIQKELPDWTVEHRPEVAYVNESDNLTIIELKDDISKVLKNKKI